MLPRGASDDQRGAGGKRDLARPGRHGSERLPAVAGPAYSEIVNDAAVRVDPAVGKQHGCLPGSPRRVLGRGGAESRQAPGLGLAVGVEKQEQARARLTIRRMASGTKSEIRPGLQHSSACARASGSCDGIVARRVVDHHQLIVGVELLEQRLEQLREVRRGVVRNHHHGQRVWTGQAAQRVGRARARAC